MEENTVLISLYNYEQLIDLKYQVKDLKEELEQSKKRFDNLKIEFLELNVNDYNMRHYGLDELTNFNSYNFGLNEKTSLFRFVTEDELIEFIKAKKEQYEKEAE